MAPRQDLPAVLFGLFLCLGAVMIAVADQPAQYAAGAIYMICSLAIAALA